ncbi:hypothetical protein DITRI_Ditri12bG0028900 [Diplodiscus trichospermus]
METLLLLVEVLGLLQQQRQERKTSLRTLFRTWPRKGIKRGALAVAAAARRGYPRTLGVAVGW